MINTATHTACADLVAGTLTRDGETRIFALDRDETYRAQHTTMLRDDAASLCSLVQRRRVVHLIEAIEHAAASKAWVLA